MISIDGTTYNIPYTVVNRKAEMLYKFAERTEDGVLHSELIGVYYNYDLQMAQSKEHTSDYTALWVKLTEPVESHTVIVPDESGTLTFTAYFANVRDGLIKEGATNYFKGLSFSIIATSPARTPA